MRFTLFKKILFSMLFISALMVVGIAWLVNYSFQTGLQDYLNEGEEQRLQLVVEKITPYYSVEQGWSKLPLSIWTSTLSDVFAQPTGDNPRPTKLRYSRAKHLLKRVHLLDVDFKPVLPGRKNRLHSNMIKVPILHDQQIIGWVSTLKRNMISDALAQSFFQQQQHNLRWIVLWVTLLSFALAWYLVRHFLTPLKRLEEATKAIQKGNYSTQITVQGNDELAALSTRFNELTRSLQQQKNTREQWLADISHELRTPLTVLKSEIEALQDGIRQPLPEYIDDLHEQVQNLSQLVEDLYQLSLSDAGLQFNMCNDVDIQDILATSCAKYQLRYQEKGINLDYHFHPQGDFRGRGDSKSLAQLFVNLLENSLRYTDPGGQLQVSLCYHAKFAEINLSDSAPSVPDVALSKLFERLYRVDESRSRLSGGAGLGLSICQTIVQAHGGEIVANHSALGGVTITITLPLLSIEQEQE